MQRHFRVTRNNCVIKRFFYLLNYRRHTVYLHVMPYWAGCKEQHWMVWSHDRAGKRGYELRTRSWGWYCCSQETVHTCAFCEANHDRGSSWYLIWNIWFIFTKAQYLLKVKYFFQDYYIWCTDTQWYQKCPALSGKTWYYLLMTQ